MSPAQTDAVKNEKPPKPSKQITILIDRTEYKVAAAELTGAQIRALPNPDIGPEFDLWIEVPNGEDRKIANDQVVKLKNGTHFFSSHSHINPGATRAE